MNLGPESSAVVTGGASGLGAATARRLVARGVKVVLLDRNEALVKETAASLECAYAALDVTDTDAVGAAVDDAAALGELRALVSCAGVAAGQTRTLKRDGTTHDMAVWQNIIAVNLVGTYNVARLFAAKASQTEPLEDGERAAIVMTASVAGHEGQAGQTAYAAAKAGVAGLTLPLARDLEVVGIRVNTISPGTFDTPLMNPPTDGWPEQAVARHRKFVDTLAGEILFPKRFGRPDEYAALAELLLTNSFINGEVIRADGGIRMRAK